MPPPEPLCGVGPLCSLRGQSRGICVGLWMPGVEEPFFPPASGGSSRDDLSLHVQVPEFVWFHSPPLPFCIPSCCRRGVLEVGSTMEEEDYDKLLPGSTFSLLFFFFFGKLK